MKSFEQTFLTQQPITQKLLQTIRLIGEYKGKQELYKQQAPQVLETLRQTAIIQSTESSNRIEGITVPLARIRFLSNGTHSTKGSFGTGNRGLSECTEYNSR
ncbi:MULTISPECIES: hypothetical protein [unclassified Microcoleus]|uniref:hypothetical protein n=1 Tax=unclassified Microcoleus TaxID=2642155 RepID=UPI002FD4D3DC